MEVSLAESDHSLSFGVDWTHSAHPTSHCWFQYSSIDSSSIPSCAYTLCAVSQPIDTESLIQCGSCTISVHRDHITDLQKTINMYDYIPPCRPSFSDSTLANNLSEQDQHHWSFIHALKEPCMRCKRKMMSRTSAVNNEKTSTISTESFVSQINAKGIHIPKHSDVKRLKPSSGLVCLWCSRSCHLWCWKILADDVDQNKCDYGKFKNIIVRPQWLHRVAGSSTRFQAQIADDIDTSNSSLTPLIVFINKLSGGQKGEMIYSQVIRLLNPRQVFLLDSDTTIKQALEIYSSLPNTRILACGGDGTIGWILSSLADTFSSLNNPPAAICPLGTGNDLARVLNWGSSYSSKRLLTILLQISNAQPIVLDRWQIALEPLPVADHMENTRNIRRCLPCLFDHPKFVSESNRPSYQNYRTPLNVRFTNYFSFGLDAAVVLDFHDSRMRNPTKFTSPFKNKLLYLNISRGYFREFVLWRAWNLGSYMRLICDGEDLTDVIRQCHTVVLLNIPSYGSGTHPWSGTSPDYVPVSTATENENNRSNKLNSNTFEDVPSSAKSSTTVRTIRQNIGDRKIEVIGLDSIQMALIHAGFRGRRIAQCSEVRIELIRSMPVHMDGDPFYLPESIAINVTHAGQVLVLRNEDS